MLSSKKHLRISREQFYFESARLAAHRSTCARGQVGCVVVRDKRIVVSGYNGSPAHTHHCLDYGCDLSLGEEAGCQRAVHAEANAISFAAKEGIPLYETQLWATHSPCLKCAQLIINAGISDVHYIYPYRLNNGIELLDDALVQVHLHEEFDGLA